MSNLGSLAGLLAYPLLIEPFSGLALQGTAWRVLHAVLLVAVLLVALAGAACLGLVGQAPAEAHATRPIPAGRRLRADGSPSVWIAATADEGLLARLAADCRQPAPRAPRPWRDDRWDLLGALRAEPLHAAPARP